jgi:hypothetical protein
MSTTPDGDAGAPRNSISITGGTFQGSAIGIGHTHQHGATIGAVAGPADLRELLTGHAAEIIAAGRSGDDRAAIQHEIGAMERELGRAEPNGPVVKSRWQAVLESLDGVVKASGSLAQVTELVNRIFGA